MGYENFQAKIDKDLRKPLEDLIGVSSDTMDTPKSDTQTPDRRPLLQDLIGVSGLKPDTPNQTHRRQIDVN